MPETNKLKRLLNDWDSYDGADMCDATDLISELRGEVVRLKATLVDISNHAATNSHPDALIRIARDALL